MAKPKNVKPLVVLSQNDAKSAEAVIYANKEGLLTLRRSLDDVLRNGEDVTLQVFEDGNWNDLRITLADHDGFDGGDGQCQCGCQEKFKNIESKYL